jgi:enolase
MRRLTLIQDYDVISIEDPFDQDDWEHYPKLTSALQGHVQIVGDDLLVTNPTRIQTGIDKKAVSALLLKVNQIGTVTESIKAYELQLRCDLKIHHYYFN